ncbi:MAG: enoyl-CoA hydratase/isomerase family protein [Acidimicrobiales bacterium]
MIGPPVRVETDAAGVATVTLDRPDRLNAMGNADWPILRVTFERLALDRGVRAVVLTGAGRAFCAGGDIKQIPTDPSTPTATRARMRDIDATAIALHHLPQPTIAGVNGDAVGAGWSLALGCDVVLAADTARFAAKFVDRGISLDLGGTWLLARHLGLQRAKHLTFTAEFLSAAEAAELGLVLQVHPAGELAAAANAYATALVARPSEALAQIKAGLNQAWAWGLEQACEFEGQAQAACVAARQIAKQQRRSAL